MRPAAPREAAGGGRKHPHTPTHPHPSAPARVPFHAPVACFQEGLASCVMEWWRRGGKGGVGRGKDRRTERWTEMRLWSSARSGGGSCCFQLWRCLGFCSQDGIATADRLKLSALRMRSKYSKVAKGARTKSRLLTWECRAAATGSSKGTI